MPKLYTKIVRHLHRILDLINCLKIIPFKAAHTLFAHIGVIPKNLLEHG